jgi:transposase InsO family protein
LRRCRASPTCKLLSGEASRNSSRAARGEFQQPARHDADAQRLPQGPDQRWSLDFVCGTLTDGRPFRSLVVVDDFTRECLCLIADTSLSVRGRHANWRC